MMWERVEPNRGYVCEHDDHFDETPITNAVYEKVGAGPSPYAFVCAEHLPAGAAIKGETLADGPRVRAFDTGATRDALGDKPQYFGYLSPIVLERFGRYMQKHQIQSDGSRRRPDNWKKGIDREAYLDSLLRHAMDLWLHEEGLRPELAREDIEEALCAIIFNAQGRLFEELAPAPEDRDV